MFFVVFLFLPTALFALSCNDFRPELFSWTDPLCGSRHLGWNPAKKFEPCDNPAACAEVCCCGKWWQPVASSDCLSPSYENNLHDCSVNLLVGELCEADWALPAGGNTWNTDNCGYWDVFKIQCVPDAQQRRLMESSEGPVQMHGGLPPPELANQEARRLLEKSIWGEEKVKESVSFVDTCREGCEKPKLPEECYLGCYSTWKKKDDKAGRSCRKIEQVKSLTVDSLQQCQAWAQVYSAKFIWFGGQAIYKSELSYQRSDAEADQSNLSKRIAYGCWIYRSCNGNSKPPSVGQLYEDRGQTSPAHVNEIGYNVKQVKLEGLQRVDVKRDVCRASCRREGYPVFGFKNNNECFCESLDPQRSLTQMSRVSDNECTSDGLGGDARQSRYNVQCYTPRVWGLKG